MGNKSKHDYGRGDNVKELFKNVIEQYANGKIKARIPDEKIEKAFAIIDTHTRLLDNMTMINNYNMSIHVITTLLSKHEDCYSSEERCKELIEEYLSVFLDFSQIENLTESLKELRDAIKSYVINSCMVYYAVYHKDKELLKQFNRETDTALRNIFKSIYKEDNKKAEEESTDNTNTKVNNNIDNEVVNIKDNHKDNIIDISNINNKVDN